eukprot:4073866-Alexandrium_andersonii.AAC.1
MASSTVLSRLSSRPLLEAWCSMLCLATMVVSSANSTSGNEKAGVRACGMRQRRSHSTSCITAERQ